MEKIQIFIITHNRPELLLHSIESVFKQSYKDIELIISDNSSNNLTKKSLEKKHYYSRLNYIKRKTVLGPIEHLNHILNEASAEYFMIFHDDDVMYPNMIEVLYKFISKNRLIAVGANAKVHENKKILKTNYNKNLKKDIIIAQRDEMVKRYLKYDMVPFPSYLYNIAVAKKMNFNIENGGKYCDAAFIIDLLKLGNIGFVASPLMEYYIHEGQGYNSFIDKMKLINYYTKTSSFNRRHPLTKRYRIQNIFVEVKQKLLSNVHNRYSKRNIMLFLLIFRHSPFEYFPRIVFFILLNKYLNFIRS